MVMDETDFEHNASKFASAFGIEMLAGTKGAGLFGAAKRGGSLYWHGSAAGVARRNASGILVDGPGNSGLFWATSKNMDELGPLAWKVGGNTNVQLIPPRLINKGGLEATYNLTSAESAMFSRAWGPNFNWNPYQWWKGAAGQYYYRQGAASWGQRAGELGKAAGITGAGVAGGYLIY
jgi:hypothetical protein